MLFDKKISVICAILFCIALFVRGYTIFFYTYPIGYADAAQHTINMLYLPKYPLIMFDYNRNTELDSILKSISPDKFFLQDNPPLYYLLAGPLANAFLPAIKDISSGFLATAVIYSLTPIIFFFFIRFITKSSMFAGFGALLLAFAPADLWHLRQGYWPLIVGVMFFLLTNFLSIKYFSQPNRKGFLTATGSVFLMVITYPPLLVAYSVSMIFYAAVNFKDKLKILLMFVKILILVMLISTPFLINFLNAYLIPSIGIKAPAGPTETQEINAVADLLNPLWAFAGLGILSIFASINYKFKIEEAIQILTPIIGILVTFIVGGYYLNFPVYPYKILGATLPHIAILLSTFSFYFLYNFSIRSTNPGSSVHLKLNKRSTKIAVSIILLSVIFVATFPKLSFLLEVKPMITDAKYDSLLWLRENTDKSSNIHFIGFFSSWRLLSFRNTSEMDTKMVGDKLEVNVSLIKAIESDYVVVSFEKEDKDGLFNLVEKDMENLAIEKPYSKDGVTIFKINPDKREELKNKIINP